VAAWGVHPFVLGEANPTTPFDGSWIFLLGAVVGVIAWVGSRIRNRHRRD
jgi:hypothetical protein